MKFFAVLLFSVLSTSSALAASLGCRAPAASSHKATSKQQSAAFRSIPRPKQASLKAANAGQHQCLPASTSYVVPETAPAIDYDSEANRLIYSPSDNGDMLPDYSYAGYRKSNEPLPSSDSIPTVLTLTPSGGNDTNQIADALAKFADLPADERGIRGALLLKAGDWKVTGPIYIKTSGVIIRGEGSGLDGTVVYDDSECSIQL